MKTELTRYLRDRLYWLILAGGVAVRAVLGWFDRRVRADAFWTIAGNFWSVTGSAATALLVLLSLIHLFSLDRETGTAPVVLSTPRGRGCLFRDRLLAGCAAAALGAVLLAVGNGALSLLLSRDLPIPAGWTETYLRSSAVAAAGAAGYFLLSACVCDLVKNQPAAMGICGCPLILSYMLSYADSFLPGDFLRPDVWWPLRCGWFSPLLRGRLFQAVPWFFPAWYLALAGGAVLLALRMRKERKER